MKQKIIKEQKADASSVSQPIAKPYVARSFSENFDKKSLTNNGFGKLTFQTTLFLVLIYFVF
jgi:hypothetical protein